MEQHSFENNSLVLSKRECKSEFDRLFTQYLAHLPLKDQIVFDEHEKYSYKHEDFELIEFLGKGQSEVIKYRHKTSGKEIAVKNLRYDYSRVFKKRNYNVTRMAKIANEIKIMHAVSNIPEIIKCYGWTSNLDTVQIFMEPAAISLENINMQRIVKKWKEITKNAINRNSAELSLLYASMWRYTLQALKYCTSKKVKHNDLKPENILVNANGQIKLCDFGESYFFCKPKFGGSIAYSSPEKFLGISIDTEKDDVWSLP